MTSTPTPDDDALTRPPSLNEDGSRRGLIPMEVGGRFRSARNWIHAVLLVVFLVGPWITINGSQAILLDIPGRRFAVFGVTFWAHDTPIIFFLLAIATIGLALVTMIWGRIWCGWACPQTVFVESVFRRVEKLVEGTYLERRRLDVEPWTAVKLFKRTVKWSLYIVISLVLSHSFVAYFTGTEALAEMMSRPPEENWTTFLVMAFITAVVAFDFGWFREQFCLIMCPYGRIQSVLMDEDSLAIVYDEDRGEPRGGVRQEGRGDCVDCLKCVNVCPTGIDIRNGQQMECVACTACIDICDDVMSRLGRATGLIRYDTLNGLKGAGRGLWRPRTWLYLALIALSVVGVVHQISDRRQLEWTVIRAVGAPYTITKNEEGSEIVINHFKVHFKNQSIDPIQVGMRLAGEIPDGLELISTATSLGLKGGEDRFQHFFVRFPRGLDRQDLGGVTLDVRQGDDVTRSPLQLVGPLK